MLQRSPTLCLLCALSFASLAVLNPLSMAIGQQHGSVYWTAAGLGALEQPPNGAEGFAAALPETAFALADSPVRTSAIGQVGALPLTNTRRISQARPFERGRSGPTQAPPPSART